MSMSELLPVVLFICGALLVPYVIYTSVKLGTYAVLRGRKIFYDQEKRRHGETHKEES